MRPLEVLLSKVLSPRRVGFFLLWIQRKINTVWVCGEKLISVWFEDARSSQRDAHYPALTHHTSQRRRMLHVKWCLQEVKDLPRLRQLPLSLVSSVPERKDAGLLKGGLHIGFESNNLICVFPVLFCTCISQRKDKIRVLRIQVLRQIL